MLVIIWILEEKCYFLEDMEIPVKIWTDHKNLEYFIMAKNLSYRQVWRLLYLVQFNFILHHLPKKFIGKSNAIFQ